MKTDKDGYITPSAVAQQHVCIRHGGTYTVDKAMKLLKNDQRVIGFGKVIEIQTPVNHRRVKRFSGATFDTLPPPAKRLLQDFKITETTNNKTFGVTEE